MSKSGPVIIIEDDVDDKEIFEQVLKDINVNNKVIWFENTSEVIDYLSTTPDRPFIIFSDINLPGKNGLELKKIIDDDPVLRKKSVPFVFYSTTANIDSVNEAYTQMTIQGFFKKSSDYEEMKKILSGIFFYWSNCIHPNI